MSDQSLAPEMAFTVASTFLSYYYSEFVKLNELARMSDLYDERSYMTLVDFRDEVPVVAHGRNAVANLLAKLDGSLGQRKVEIITVDTVALPHNCVQVICQGVMYLREYRRVFLHVFVLEPTAYRTKTYHISSDYLRFVDSEKEVIPEGSVVIAADQVANYLEESRRRVEEEQRRQLIEFQQRIRAQQEAAQARAKAEAEAARAKAQREQHQQQQAAAAAVRIPQPASRQGRAEGPHPHRNEAAEGGNDRRERRERPPRDGGNNDRHERPAGAAGTRHNEEGRPERKPREQRGDGRAEREPRGESHTERKPRGDGRPEREPRGEGHAERKPRGEGRAEREPRGEGRGDRKPRGEGHAERKPVEGSDRRKKPAAAGAAGDAAPAAPAPERKPRATGPTAACILLRVPKKIKLSDIKAELASQGGAVPDDMFWCGPSSAHAVLKFDSVDKATALYSKKVFTIQEESIPVNYYHE